jgi:hypothetical protein|nr:MAG TPA: repressor protein C2 [Caudoviricetes sp.]
MDESSVKQRIREILTVKESNPTKLSKDFSVNQKTLNNQINSDVQLSSSTILLILKAFPDLSAEWLLRGEGNMLKKNSSSNIESGRKITVSIDENGFLKIVD